MGSAVKSAANATADAARDVRNTAQTAYRRTASRGLREEVARTTAALMPSAYAGNAVAVGAAESGGDVSAGLSQAAADLGLGQTIQVADAQAQPAPTAADPQQRRRRQAAGRAGTILTGGMDGGGTNLGGAGGRSTLLGL